MKQGVLLLAHGAPERLEDVASYLTFVRGGRPQQALAPEPVAALESELVSAAEEATSKA